MIRSYFGIAHNPFENPRHLLDHQQPIFDTLRVHCQQDGLCLILGQPGIGKSVLKNYLTPEAWARSTHQQALLQAA